MLRRTTAIFITAAALSLAIVAPARAEAPPLKDYSAGATATALQLTLLGQQLAVSQTQAAISSAPKAAADGAALLLAGNPVPGAAPSAAPGGAATNQVCPIQADLDAITGGALSALQLEVACVSTSASVADGPTARSGSGEVTIRILAPGGTLLEPLLGPVLDAVTQLTDPIIVALNPLLGVINDLTQIDVANVLDQLTTALGDDLFVLAEIVVAPTVSQTSATAANGVVAEAGSNGVTINVLPGIASTLDALTDLISVPNASTGPLLSVKLGTANAKVVRDPSTGAAVPDASAAQLLSITADDSLGILSGLTGTLTGALDNLSVSQLSCDSGLLADVLCVDLGAVNELDSTELAARNMDFGAGTVGREASAATVRVLPIAAAALGGDVLGLSLASATAAANATPAELGRQAPPATTPPASLPKTGGNSALPLTLGLLAVAAAGATLLRRTRTI